MTIASVETPVTHSQTDAARAARRAIGAAAIALLAACSTRPEPPKPPPLPPLIEQPGKALVRVAEADSGARIVLERSQELVVRLALDVGSRTEWSLVDPLPGTLIVVSGPTFERAPRNEAFNESDGTAVWHLKAQAAGSATLAFERRRPRSLEPATQTASYSVTVK